MKVLIFGGEGFIGTHFQNFLQNQSGITEILSYDLEQKDESRKIDVRKPINLKGDFSSSDWIINLAAIHRTPGHPDYDYFETNILGAKNICDFADKNGINNLIFTSSIAPYGASEETKYEDTLPTPNTPYGISKLVAEEIHKTWAAKDSERKLMILRPGVVFGKGENGNFSRLASAISKGYFFYPGRKDTIKGCIYVKELVFQTWSLFRKQESSVETYNFAYFPAYTIESIAGGIAEVLGAKPPRILIPSWILSSAASVLTLFGFSKLGIHPDRVRKLMISTNISGKKLAEKAKSYKFNFKEALDDWYKDCNKEGLY